MEISFGLGGKRGPKCEKAALCGRGLLETKLIWKLFSVVVGHGAAHHRRRCDDGKMRGGWSDWKSWAALIQPNG
jgi:hypothetical protein